MRRINKLSHVLSSRKENKIYTDADWVTYHQGLEIKYENGPFLVLKKQGESGWAGFIFANYIRVSYMLAQYYPDQSLDIPLGHESAGYLTVTYQEEFGHNWHEGLKLLISQADQCAEEEAKKQVGG